MIVDVFSPDKRSDVMSRIRSSGNQSTEALFVKILRFVSITGWRRNVPIFGKPDFVFPKERIVVFIDGCFWHYCPRHGRIPSSRQKYWRKKINRNVERDMEVNRYLRQNCWKVIRFWACELKEKPRLNRKLRQLRRMLGIL